MAASSSSFMTTVLADELLLEVFLRLASPVTVVRASAVCKPWRRLITDPSFLRRFHLLHRSLPLLGFFVQPLSLDLPFFIPSIQPDPELRAAVCRGDFSFPLIRIFQEGTWQLCDYLDTLFLFVNSDSRYIDEPNEFRQLAAYDPFNRRCTIIDPTPSSFFNIDESGSRREASFRGKYKIAIINRTLQWFQVAFIINNGSRMRAAVFSSDTESWCLYPWSEKLIRTRGPFYNTDLRYFDFGKVVNGSLYWRVTYEASFMMAMDTRTMQFSVIDIPPRANNIGETEDGELCIVGISHEAMLLSVWIHKKEGDGVERWVLEKEVSLQEELCRIIPLQYGWQRFGALKTLGKGYVYFKVENYSSHILSLRLKTMQLEKLATEGEVDGYGVYVHPCTITWPPSFRG